MGEANDRDPSTQTDVVFWKTAGAPRTYSTNQIRTPEHQGPIPQSTPVYPLVKRGWQQQRSDTSNNDSWSLGPFQYAQRRDVTSRHAGSRKPGPQNSTPAKFGGALRARVGRASVERGCTV